LSFQLSVFRLQFRYQPALKIETRKLALLFLTGRLLLSNRGATRTFARTRIGVRALAANGQPTTMAQSAICADVHQTLDVHLNALAKIAFYLSLTFQDRANPAQLIFVQIPDMSVEIYL